MLDGMLVLYDIGPISDQFVRKAYVAAYDRRLRHPAWVRSFPFLSLTSYSRVFP